MLLWSADADGWASAVADRAGVRSRHAVGLWMRAASAAKVGEVAR